MATLFHLVRHGAYALLDHAFGGREPHPLSDAGRAQAGRIAVALKSRAVAAIVASPVQRAVETAAPIATQFGLTIQIDPAFTEIDFAGWTGQSFDDLHVTPAWHAWNRFRSTACVPGGEGILDVQRRAIAGLSRLAGTYPDAEIVIVSHADVIKVVVTHVLGAPLDLMRRIEIGPGSVSTIALYDEDARVLSVNTQP